MRDTSADTTRVAEQASKFIDAFPVSNLTKTKATIAILTTAISLVECMSCRETLIQVVIGQLRAASKKYPPTHDCQEGAERTRCVQ